VPVEYRARCVSTRSDGPYLRKQDFAGAPGCPAWHHGTTPARRTRGKVSFSRRGSPSNGLTQLLLPPPPAGPLEARQQGGSPGGTCSRTLVHADRSYAVLAAGVAAGQRRLHRPACRRLDESAISWRSARITGLPPDTARDVAYIREGRRSTRSGAGLTHRRSRRWEGYITGPAPRGPRSISGGGADIRCHSSRYDTGCCART